MKTDNFTVRLQTEDREILRQLADMWKRTRGDCLRLAFRFGAKKALELAEHEQKELNPEMAA